VNPPYTYRNLPWMENANGRQSGQVLIGLESGPDARLDLYNYMGSNLPAYLLYIVLKIVLGANWVEWMEERHQNRKGRWKVETVLNPEGSKEYRLYTDGQDGPVCSSAITVSESRLHTFSIPVEDATPLFKEIIEDYPPVFLPRYKNYRYTYFFPTYYPFYAKNITVAELPEPIKTQREEVKKLAANPDIFLSGSFEAGETSGIIETIEALKCMEVFLA